MDQIAAAGYSGTELGPWGFYPTDPDQLRSELERRGLTLASAFCPVELTEPDAYPLAERQALEVAALLRALGTDELILADPQRPTRATIAGRVSPADELPADKWDVLIDGLNHLGARLARDGMTAVYHHHAATYVETMAEIDRLLDRTDPTTVGLCLDTGHAAYGGADPVAILRRWGDRVRYVHLKDVDPAVLADIQTRRLDYEAGVRAGAFCPLGRGCVDFAGVFRELRRHAYTGWLIVEQDVIFDDTGTPASPLDAARQSRAFLNEVMSTEY
jgi:inosose dehydratase